MGYMLHDFCSDEQRAVVLADDQYILLNGCAGSRKTDTLVRVCLRRFLEGQNVLIITLVGSVTNELRERLEGALPGCSFRKAGNHYLYEPVGQACIEIANYDAMLHTQLASHNDPFLLRYGSCFTRKAAFMLEKYVRPGKHRTFVLRNGRTAGVLLMDEFQDLPPIKARILTGILRAADGDVRAVAAGDYVQSIFDHAFEEGEPHPMDVWREDLDAAYFQMTRCFRCPRAQVRFVNRLLAPFVDDFNLPPMAAASDDDYHRPLLFACPSENSNHTAHSISGQVCAMLAELRATAEPGLQPGDVAVIMPRSNRNPVFHQLVLGLERLYTSWGCEGETVALFETRGDNFVRPIDWSKAVGRTVLLSVHGDKGKGHRVVFFLGLSEGVIPSANRLFTGRELIDVSLLNVALTRSTRWLFVGVSRDRPSRYIRNARDVLNEYAVLAWDEDGGDDEVYQRLVRASLRCYEHLPESFRRPNFDYDRYVARRINAPLRLMSQIKNDVSTLYEHPMDVAPHYPWRDGKELRFGSPTNIPLQEERLACFGVMGELMFQREYCQRKGRMGVLRAEFGFLLDAGGVHYTRNERLLNILQDERFNLVVAPLPPTAYAAHVNQLCLKYKDRAGPRVIAELQALQARPVRVAPAYLDREAIAKEVEVFISDAPNRELPASTFWDVAIVYMSLYDSIVAPGIVKWLGDFPHDLTILLANTERFYELVASLDISFHTNYQLCGAEWNKETLDDMGIFDECAYYGIRGQSDFETDTAVFEIKCPRPNGQSGITNSWIIQPLMYMCLNMDRRVNEINVVDLTNGVWYQYPNMDRVNRMAVIRDVLMRLQHREEHIKVLMGSMRKNGGSRAGEVGLDRRNTNDNESMRLEDLTDAV